MFFIKTVIDNLCINYIKQGEGKAVLILPGWGTTIATYTLLFNSIATYANVYCLDMPGFGESDEPQNSWNVDDFVEFVIKFIKNQGIKELDLIGHSNGGRIIIKLLSKDDLDFKVNKVILMGSAGIVHEKSFSQKMRIRTYKMCKKLYKIGLIKAMFPNMLNKFGSEDYKNSSPTMRQTMVKLVNEDLRDYLPNIKVPTLLIWGENDTATPISDAYLMEKLIPDAGLVKVEGCTHYAFIENPYFVNTVIKTFLNG